MIAALELCDTVLLRTNRPLISLDSSGSKNVLSSERKRVPMRQETMYSKVA